jgi:hypothetical protein
MNLLGLDSETPHELKSGDTISADMFNEIFDYINNANKMITASDLIGTWSCEFYTQTGDGCGLVTGGGTLSSVGTDSLYKSNTTTIVMDRHDNGTYIYTSTIPNLFFCGDSADNGTGLGNWVVKNNVLFYDFYKWGIKGNPSFPAQLGYAKLKKVSYSKLLMEMPKSDTVFAECDKQNLPPISPTLDNVTQIPATSDSGYRVSLTWTDNSNDETGFNVLRKDTLKGIWDNVTTSSTSADATSYIDTVTEAKKYWYRVSATNSIGDSTPSKVIDVVVE